MLGGSGDFRAFLVVRANKRSLRRNVKAAPCSVQHLLRHAKRRAQRRPRHRPCADAFTCRRLGTAGRKGSAATRLSEKHKNCRPPILWLYGLVQLLFVFLLFVSLPTPKYEASVRAPCSFLDTVDFLNFVFFGDETLAH